MFGQGNAQDSTLFNLRRDDFDNLVNVLHQSFRKRETDGEIFKVARRPQHHRVGDTVVFECDRLFRRKRARRTGNGRFGKG